MIRKIDPSWKSLKKKDITIEMVKSLLTRRTDLAADFYSEILSIIGPKDMTKVYSVFCQKYRRDPSNGSQPLLYGVVESYAQIGLYEAQKGKKPVIKLSDESKIAEEFENAIKHISKARTRLDSIIVLLRRFESLSSPEARGEIRVRLVPICRNFINDLFLVEEANKLLSSYGWQKVSLESDLLSSTNYGEKANAISNMIDKIDNMKLQSKTLDRDTDASVSSLIKGTTLLFKGMWVHTSKYRHY